LIVFHKDARGYIQKFFAQIQLSKCYHVVMSFLS